MTSSDASKLSSSKNANGMSIKVSDDSSEFKDHFSEKSFTKGGNRYKSKKRTKYALENQQRDSRDSNSEDRMENLIKKRAGENRSQLEIDTNQNLSETIRSVQTDYISNEES